MKSNENGETEDKWQRVIEEQQQSGMAAKAFCQKRGHSFFQFKYWKQKLSQRSQATPRLVAVVRKDRQEQSDSSVALEIGPVRIVVKQGFDAGLLRETLQAIGGLK